MPRGSGMLLAGASPRPWLEKTRGDAPSLEPGEGRRTRATESKAGGAGPACAQPPGPGGSGGAAHGYLD